MRQIIRVVFNFVDDNFLKYIFCDYVIHYIIIANTTMLLGALDKDIYLILIGVGAIIFLVLYYKVLDYFIKRM